MISKIKRFLISDNLGEKSYIVLNHGKEFAHLIKIAHFNEQLWAIGSNHSGQISDCEQIAPVAPDKRVKDSELLMSLMTKELLWAIHSGHSQ